MYLQHFGFQHPPFAINPDPRFLYLSPKHQEALAHLLYGLGEGGGFVMLSGEVGTGKTTLCYTLLENLGDNVDVALILNSRLNSLELLAALCDELHIAYPPATESRKLLVDALNQFLLANHGRGRRTVAVIDEAQNLSNDVMEQVRLLTNLETPTTKLLQIVLIGQPELPALLSQQELRQVDQRITARFHLGSLDRHEAGEYVRHRLAVAGGARNLFSEAAIRAVFAGSRGIPRLINVICDRALLGAYTLDLTRVDRRVVEKACREVLGSERTPSAWVAAAAASAFMVVAAASLVAVVPRLGDISFPARSAASVPMAEQPKPPVLAQSTPAAAMPPVTEPAPRAAVPEQPDFAIWARNARNLESNGLQRLVRYWRPDAQVPFPISCEGVKDFGLRCVRQRVVWDELRRQNLPALISVRTGQGPEYSLLMTSADATDVTFLSNEGAAVRYPSTEVLPYWVGSSLVLWAPPSNRLLLVPGMRDQSVIWLRERLELAGYTVAPIESALFFDELLKDAVRRFQEGRGLPVDGIAGERTLIALNGIRPPKGVSSVSLNR